MKHIFIINPTAGKTDSRQKIYDMAESLRQKHGLDVQCILTKKQGHATELAKKLCETGEALRFYACGGDGTVNEVANGIIGYDNAAMTVIPVGTGNDFLKNFGDDMEKFPGRRKPVGRPAVSYGRHRRQRPRGADHRLLRHRRAGGPGRT